MKSGKSDKSTNTVREKTEEKNAADLKRTNSTNGTTQLVEEMKHLREENKTLKDQVNV